MSPRAGAAKRPKVDLDVTAERCEALKLVYAAQCLPELLEEASRENLSPVHFLDRVLEQELGFRPLDRQEANLFFRLVSARYEKGSIILTSNKHIRDWPEIFAGDEVLTTAILDRLLHHVHIVHIDGRSYRLRELDGLLRSPPPSPQGKGGDAQTK